MFTSYQKEQCVLKLLTTLYY